MMTQFATVQFSHEELQELHQALLQRAILEDDVRRERGEEPIATHPLLEKFEILLGHSEAVLQRHEQELEDELWEHAWRAFTDEWAHFRAHQDAEREAKRSPRVLAEQEVTTRAHKLYHKRFDKYVAEIAMTEQEVLHTTQMQRSSTSSSATRR